MNGGEDGAGEERFTGAGLVGVEDDEGEAVDAVVEELAEHGADDGAHGAAAAVIQIASVQREVVEDVEELTGDGFRGVEFVPGDGEGVCCVDAGGGVVADGGGLENGFFQGGAGAQDGEADGGYVVYGGDGVAEGVCFQ